MASAVVAVGLWILRDFLAALVWATVLAIAFWPIYRRLRQPVSRPIDRVVAPALATTIIGIIFIAPIVLIGIAVARESHLVVQFISEARHHGIAAPGWIDQLPLIGPWMAEWWQSNLGDPTAAEELIGRVNLRTLTESVREYGAEVVHQPLPAGPSTVSWDIDGSVGLNELGFASDAPGLALGMLHFAGR